MPVAAASSVQKQAFFITCDPARLGKAKRLPLELSLVRADKTLWIRRIDTPTLKKGKSVWVSYKGWKPGSVQLVIKEVQPDNKATEAGRIELRVPSVIPEWTRFKMLKLPAVPAPWTPVRASRNRAVVWGRDYSFGRSPFLDQVELCGR